MRASQLLYEVPVVGERTGMAAHETDRETQEKGFSSSL